MKVISGTRRAHLIWIRRIRDRMVVVFTTTYAITTRVVSSNSAHELYPIQPYVIKFVSDLLKVDCFLNVLWFPLPAKQIATITKKTSNFP